MRRFVYFVENPIQALLSCDPRSAPEAGMPTKQSGAPCWLPAWLPPCRNAPADVLRWAVADAVMCTHVHPEAADAAIVQAAAVGLLAKPGESLLLLLGGGTAACPRLLLRLLPAADPLSSCPTCYCCPSTCLPACLPPCRCHRACAGVAARAHSTPAAAGGHGGHAAAPGSD